MKICHMTSAHDSNDIRIFQKECVYLAKNPKNQVFLVAPGESREERNVNVIGVGKYGNGRLGRMFRLSRDVYKAALALDADIYHFHDPELLPYGLKLKKRGKCVIFDSHENTAEQIKIKKYIPKGFRKLVSSIYFKYETKVCLKLDAVIFPAIDVEESMFKGRSQKIVLVDNLPILEEMVIDRSKKIPGAYCCVGTLTEDRGITKMLEASKLIRGTLILAGRFYPEDYKEELEKKGLLDSVKYKGIVNRDEVVEIYNQSNVGLSTLLHVGQYDNCSNFPTKEYEYMAMGIPVVRTDFKKTKKLFEKYDFGISVNPDNPEDIANAVNLLLENDNLRREKGENGLKAAKSRFNWESEATKITELYNSLLKEM